jgi:hypothetical protein
MLWLFLKHTRQIILDGSVGKWIDIGGSVAGVEEDGSSTCTDAGEREEEELFLSHHPSTAWPRSASFPPYVYVLQGARVAVMETVVAAVVVVVLGARVC